MPSAKQMRKRKQKRKQIIRISLAVGGGLILILGIILGFGYLYSSSHDVEKMTAKHQALIDEMRTIARKGMLDPSYSVKKILVIDATTRQIDPIFFAINSVMQADTPEQVDLFVELSWGEKIIGYYDKGGGVAKQPMVMVKVINARRKEIVIEQTITGSEPPRQIRVGHPDEGQGRLSREIVIEFLHKLRAP